MGDTPVIRVARDHADVEACVELQRVVWELDDLDVTGPIQLLATMHAGALLMVAEDEDGAIVAFSYAFPGLDGTAPHLHSDMLAVHPKARRQGLGARMKWAQRKEALERKIELITWTFDPLQATNGRLNLRRLGATATTLIPNLYGTTSSSLHHGLPTDRLSVRWELLSPGVKERAGGTPPPPAAKLLDATRVNDVTWEEDRAVSTPPRLDLEDPTLLFEVPAEWNLLCRSAPSAARAWHGVARRVFEAYLPRGYRATDLLTVKDKGRPRPRYVLYRFPASDDAATRNGTGF